nr:uncharacterized protein LOC127319713 [Lolium perenne]
METTPALERRPALIHHILCMLGDAPSARMVADEAKPTALVAEREKEAPPIWTKSVTSQAVKAAAAAAAAAAEGRKLSAETSVRCDGLPEEEATCARCRPWTRMKNPHPVEAAATSQPARTTKSATAARVAPIGSGVPVEPLMTRAKASAMVPPAESIPVEPLMTRAKASAMVPPAESIPVEPLMTRAKASAMVPPAESIPMESGGGRPSQQSSSSTERILQKGPAPREDPQSDQFKSSAAVGIQKGLSALEGVTVATSSEEDGISAHNVYNQYLDLYIYGFPVSSFWFDMWIVKPLILHDREFIGPLQYLKSRGRNECPPLDGTPNFSHEVTAVLNSHPGPIEYFRLDSSEWSSDQLLQWMRILRSKSVNEVIVVNIACSPRTSFPVLEMHSTEKLSIGFFFHHFHRRCILSSFAQSPQAYVL